MTDERPVPDTFARRESIAAVCLEEADATGDSRFTRAAGALLGKLAGRPEIDDTEALEFAVDLLTSEAARSINDACVQTANVFSPTPMEIDAMIQRLRRKLPKRLVITSHDQ